MKFKISFKILLKSFLLKNKTCNYTGIYNDYYLLNFNEFKSNNSIKVLKISQFDNINYYTINYNSH